MAKFKRNDFSAFAIRFRFRSYFQCRQFIHLTGLNDYLESDTPIRPKHTEIRH